MKIEDGERIDEPGDDGPGDELHHQVEPQQTPATIWITPHQDRCGEQVFDAMVPDRAAHHENRDSRRGSRNHAGTPADQGDRDGNGNRGVKPDPGIHAGDDRKADRLGNKGKRDDDASQNVPADTVPPSVEPLAAIIIANLRDMGNPQQSTWRQSGRYRICMCDVVRRIGGRNSHPEFHRVLAN
jgi:hypothetical protein